MPCAPHLEFVEHGLGAASLGLLLLKLLSQPRHLGVALVLLLVLVVMLILVLVVVFASLLLLSVMLLVVDFDYVIDVLL